MTGIKATLKIVLQANDTVVAESDSSELWQRVLIAINSSDPRKFEAEGSADRNSEGNEMISCDGSSKDKASSDTATADALVIRFAKSLGVTPEQVEGACSPSKEAPYLTLDMHCWNSFKDQTPARGRGSLSPLVIAATLLSLWKQEARLGNATQAEAQKVLETINLNDKNPTRAIQSADWLQGRPGGVVVINPARIKRAVSIGRAFCKEDWHGDTSWKGAPSE